MVTGCTDFGGWCKKWTIVNFRPNRSIHSYILSSSQWLIWPYYPDTWYQPCMSTLCSLLHRTWGTRVLDGIMHKIQAQMFASFHQKNLQFTDMDNFNLTWLTLCCRSPTNAKIYLSVSMHRQNIHKHLEETATNRTLSFLMYNTAEPQLYFLLSLYSTNLPEAKSFKYVSTYFVRLFD